jgi:predicted choloylglycine hydrolase
MKAIVIDSPEPDTLKLLDLEREQVSENHYKLGNNWIKKNPHGIWEVYIEGDPFERGVVYGKLCVDLIQDQEDLFVKQIESLMPSNIKRAMIKVFVGFFNRNIAEYIPEEFRNEIYGVSFAFADRHDNVGPKFYRVLNYHAAHDIGHALEELNMVGCTSFTVNKGRSADGELLVGRNFDFYMGDDFARDKVLTIVRPNEGIPFVMYSWAGLTGVVSGMNYKGLTVTLNASKSTIPRMAKEPISVLAREILQYSSTIDQAVEIAKKREVFVSESLLIASAEDNRSVIIEKSPSGFDVYETEEDHLVCANHYQSDHFKDTDINKENIEKSDSNPRHLRMHELIERLSPVGVDEAISILRNKEGVGDQDMSLGNPASVNQLIAHHATVMLPVKKKVWFSTAPFQLGKFVCYDLEEMFKNEVTLAEQVDFDSELIAEDPFAQTEAFKKYERYRAIKKTILDSLSYKKKMTFSEEQIQEYIDCNPDSYIVYMTLGELFHFNKKYNQAKHYLKIALTKVLSSVEEGEKIEALIKKCK